MPSFALLVTQPAFDSNLAFTAIKFAHAAIEADHQVNGIFFYQAGVTHANAFLHGLSDDQNLAPAWKSLLDKNVALMTCVTAANRRGILSDEDSQDINHSCSNLVAGFQQVGLGELMVLIKQSDRVVQF